jgi:hypothetical protein
LEGCIFETMEIGLILLYTVLLLFISSKINIERKSALPKFSFQTILLLKFGVGVFIYLLYTKYYTTRADADIFKYFDDSTIIFDYLKSNPSAIWDVFINSKIPSELGPKMISWFTGWGVHLVDSNQTMIKLHLLIHLFSFGSYHIHSLVFCFLSFLGSVALYNAVVKYLNIHPWLAMLSFLLPSVLLWSSAPLKETLVVMLLSFSIAQIIKFLFEKNKKHMLYASLFLIPLFFVKPYFVIGLAPFLPLLLFRETSISKKYLIAITLFIVAALTINFLPNGQTIIGGIVQKQNDFLNHAEAENAGSLIYLPRLENNYWSLIKTIPIALFNLFLKPLPWDSLNPLFLLASMENLFLIALIIIATVYRKTSLSSEQKELLWLLSLYSLIIYTLIGLTTPVVGAFVRYKAPILPLILTACFIVLDFEKIKKYVPFKKYL